jgi:hypothetical protein
MKDEIEKPSGQVLKTLAGITRILEGFFNKVFYR